MLTAQSDDATAPTRAGGDRYPWRDTFVEALWARGGDLNAAAVACALSLATVHRALGEDPQFKGRVDQACAQLAGSRGPLELRPSDGELFQPAEIQAHPWLLRFLVTLREEWGNVTAASRAVGISRGQAYRVAKELPAFEQAWADAVEESTDKIEANAVRLAVEGTREPIFSKGEIIGERAVPYPNLILGLLRARRRQTYGPQQLELFGEEGDGGIRIILPVSTGKGTEHGAS